IYTHFENPQRIFAADTETLLADTRGFAALPHDAFVDGVTGYFFHPEDCAIAKNEMEKLAQSITTSYEARLRRHDDSYL
ncbi:MAG: hypothetical protein RSF89_05350, partial [Oscillospiraceae bacterium]